MEESRQRAAGTLPSSSPSHTPPSSYCSIFFDAKVYDEQGSKKGAGEINMLCFASALLLLLVKSQDTKIRWCSNAVNHSAAWSGGSAGASRA